jgi:hypothetical protein
MRTAILLGVGVALLGLAGAGPAAPAPRDAQAGLTALIEHALREDGSFFTSGERSVIERKCGYRPGEWDGFEADIENDVFRCINGRRVDDPEMRSVMRAAAPRIARRVEQVMARADVRAAIGRVASEAAARAMARFEPLAGGAR